MNINVLFYDYYGQLSSDQTITVDDELASLDLSLSQLEDYGVVPPVLDDIRLGTKNYLFTKWEKHLSKIDGVKYKYLFWSKYVEEDMIEDHYNDKVDKVEYYVDRLGVDIKSFIDSDNNTINEIKNKVQNWDGYTDLADELQRITAVNTLNEQKVLLLNSSNFDAQIRVLGREFESAEDIIDNAYEADTGRLDDDFENVSNISENIDYINDVISNRVKHVFLTNAEYGSLPVKDMDTLYFTT